MRNGLAIAAWLFVVLLLLGLVYELWWLAVLVWVGVLMYRRLNR